MSAKADEVKLDIEEFNELLRRAGRKRSKDVLSLEIRRLQTELAKLIEENTSSSIKPTHSVSNPQKCYEVKLNNYGWDQTDTTMKLYVTLPNVQQLPMEAVTCNFTEKSLDLRVLGLDNKNYSLTINNLYGEIDVNQSFVKIRTHLVIVSLAKKVEKNWSHVTGVEKTAKLRRSFTEKRIKKLQAAAVSDMSDASHSLMNLMQIMYQEGDDEMKKTIAKELTEKAAGLPNIF